MGTYRNDLIAQRQRRMVLERAIERRQEAIALWVWDHLEPDHRRQLRSLEDNAFDADQHYDLHRHVAFLEKYIMALDALLGEVPALEFRLRELPKEVPDLPALRFPRRLYLSSFIIQEEDVAEASRIRNSIKEYLPEVEEEYNFNSMRLRFEANAPFVLLLTYRGLTLHFALATSIARLAPPLLVAPIRFFDSIRTYQSLGHKSFDEHFTITTPRHMALKLLSANVRDALLEINRYYPITLEVTKSAACLSWRSTFTIDAFELCLRLLRELRQESTQLR